MLRVIMLPYSVIPSSDKTAKPASALSSHQVPCSCKWVFFTPEVSPLGAYMPYNGSMGNGHLTGGKLAKLATKLVSQP